MNEKRSSDPLPYTQVDRAVKPKAATLSSMIGVTYQHALGSLVDFWDLCGDPRDLEKLLAEGKDEVLLTDAEVRMRFMMASGKQIEPAQLAALGILEPKEELFRVRGMSRFFAPLRRRKQALDAASKGGKTTAEARKAAGETARGADGRFTGGSSDVAPTSVANTVATTVPSTVATTVATPEREPRTAYSVQRSATIIELPLPSGKPVVVVEDPARPFWEWVGEARTALGKAVERERPSKLLDWIVARQGEGRSDRELSEAYALFLRDEDFADKGWPTAIFLSDKIWPSRMRGPQPPREARL